MRVPGQAQEGDGVHQADCHLGCPVRLPERGQGHPDEPLGGDHSRVQVREGPQPDVQAGHQGGCPYA